MAIGELTKQLAGQALGDMLDSLRPPDLSRITETVRSAKPAGGAGENTGATIVGQVQAMQKAVKEDEELLVLYHGGGETVRVLEFFLPSWQVVVLTGIDTEKNITRVIAPAESLQLVCKAMKVHPPAKPVRIGFIAPRPKPE
jgi:hypothetical protein